MSDYVGRAQKLCDCACAFSKLYFWALTLGMAKFAAHSFLDSIKALVV